MLRLSILAAVLVLLAGCGGDDDGSSQDPAPAPAETVAGEGPDRSAPESDAAPGDTTAAGPPRAMDDDSAGEPEAVSRTEYIREADRICADVRKDLGAEGRKLQDVLQKLAARKIGKREYYRLSGDLTERFAELVRAAVDRIERLPRPKERRDALDDYLAATRAQSRLFAEQAEVQRRGDVQASAEVNRRLARAAARTRAAARRFGFRTCGGG